MSENTPLLSVDLPAELRQRQSELAQSLLRHCPRDGIYGTAVEPLALIRADGPTLPARGMHKPALCIIAQGRKEVQLAEERYIYDPLHYLVVSVTLPLAGQVIDASPDAPYLCVRLDIDPAEITQLISDAGPMEVASRRGDRGLYVDRIDASLLDAVLRLIHLLDSPRDIPMLAPLILREIFYRLLRSGQGQRLHEIAIADSQAHRITRAIDWINQNYGKPLRIEQLAQVVNLSPSTLHHRFKAVTAMSPLQYQKQLRLQEARRLIFSEGLEVAAAGYRVGYESPSQFSREYSRLFGAPRNRTRHDPSPAPAPACPVPSRRGDGQRVVRPPLPGLCPCRRPAQRTTLARLADGRQGLPLQRWPQYLGRRCRRPRAAHHGGGRQRPGSRPELCLSALPGPSGGAAADQRRAPAEQYRQ